MEVLLLWIVDPRLELEPVWDRTPENEYIHTMVVMNSIPTAVRMEDRLLESGE